MEALRQGAIAFLAHVLAVHVDHLGVAAQLLVDTADAVVHRWFVEDDGMLACPERLTEKLCRMLGAYVAMLEVAREG